MFHLSRPADLPALLRREKAFVLLAGFSLIAAILGGASRADVASLVILRPVSVLMCGIALLSLSRDSFARHRWAFAIALALMTLTVLHLLPTPYSLWSGLPGRELAVEADATFGLGELWRPVALVPSGAWNAFYSLFTPLAALLLGVQLSSQQLQSMIKLVLIIGIASGIVGLLQISDGPTSSAYLYRVTNRGSAVGLFANRNHQALLLAMLLPMLAYYASLSADSSQQAFRRKMLAGGAALAVIPLMLTTGSRSGLVLGACGIIGAAVLYAGRSRRDATQSRRRQNHTRRRLPILFAGASILLATALTALSVRSEAFSRLFYGDTADEQRLLVWGPIAKMAWQYFPLGSGVGSFAEVYAVHEPERLLGPVYLNHAHNEYLEIFLTTGLLGCVLLLIVVGALAAASVRAWVRPGVGDEGRTAKLGTILLAMIAIASIVDYPLRTPLLACVFVIAVLCVSAMRPPLAIEPAFR